VDDFAQVPGVPVDISRSERKWVGAADLVLVTSSFLRQKHIKQRPDVIQVPPGVDYELFNQAYSAEQAADPIERVCFFGGMGANWFDFDLVQSIAEAGFSVSLIGYKDTQHRLFSHPNVTYLPPVPQGELPELLKPMSALLIPYKLNGFTRGVFPTKVYECLATGKPLVATPLPDLQGELSKHVYLASDAKEFIEVLYRLPELETQERVQARLELARKNSWKGRCGLVSRELERLVHA
jgi:glycosyltransferase involved in cell wall biosynthesis